MKTVSMLLFARTSAIEILLILFFLMMVFLIPLIIIGVVFYILRRNNKNRAVWNLLAQKLNFNMRNPKKLEMTGFYNNCEVKVSVGSRRSGSSSNRSVEFFTYCIANFPYSLRFALHINSQKGLLSNVLDLNEMVLGNPYFDRAFNVRCYSAQILQSLLLSDFPSGNARNLMDDLMTAKQAGIIKVTDKQVYIEKGGQIGDENEITQMLYIATDLVNRFRAARETFPLTNWEKQMLAAWQNLARQHGLSLDTKNYILQGNYQHFPVFIALETDTGKWQTNIKLRFPDSLMTGLKIMPENSVHKALTWFGVQDIEAGIKEFDDTFIVKGKNVEAAKYKLQPDFCFRLVELNRQTSNISIDDEEISVTFDTVLGDGRMLKSCLDTVVSTAKMLLR